MLTSADMVGRGRVHWQSWQETYTGLMPQAVLDNQTEEKCVNIARRFPDNTLVAKVNGEVVGFVCYGAYRDESLPDAGEISALYLLRAHQRCGIGRALTDAAMRKLASYPRIALWVLKGNENAIRFYQKYGFCFDGTEKHSAAGTELRMIYKRA